ncbi:MAG: AMP-binding enzyme, partial [Arenicellales bacterium]
VEAEIDNLPGVKESAVIAVPHPDFGEAVVAVVVTDSSINVIEQYIIDALRDRLARFKQPKKVILLDELPRNTMGKVQKNLLRDTYKGLFR